MSLIINPLEEQLTVIGIYSIIAILFELGCFVHHILDSWLNTLSDDFPTKKAASLPFYKGEEVDPVLMLP